MPIKKYLFIFFALLSFLTSSVFSSSFSEKVYKLDSIKKNSSALLHEYTYFINDKNVNYKLSKLKDLPLKKFSTFKKIEEVSLGPLLHSIWGKIYFENSDDRVKEFFLSAGAYVKNLEYELYDDAGKLVDQGKTGLVVNPKERSGPLNSRGIKIKFKKQGNYQLVFKLDSYYLADILFTLNSSKKYFSDLFWQNIFWSVFIGILLAVFGHSLYSYFSSRDDAYLYYSFLIFSTLLNLLSIVDTMQNNWYFLFGYFGDYITITASFTLFLGFLFSAKIAYFDYYLPKFINIFKIFFLSVLILLCVPLIFKEQLQNGLFALSVISPLSIFILYFSLFIVYKKSKKIEVLILILSWSCVLFFAITSHFLAAIGLATGDDINKLFAVGTLCEIFVMSFALTYKISEHKKNLIQQFRQSERELENEVKIKTQEVFDAHEEYMKSKQIIGLGQVAAGLAHEINNSLAILRGHTDRIFKLIKRFTDGLSDPYLKQKSIVHSSINRISEIVKSIYFFSNDDTDLFTKESVLIKDIFQTVKLDFDEELKESNIVLSYTNMPKDRTILVNKTEMTRAVSSIIRNSVDSVQLLENVNDRSIWVDFLDERGKTSITFNDSGPGINKDDQINVFEPFFTKRKKEERVGLGLSISKKIINMFDGNINCERSKEFGAEKYFIKVLIQFLLILPFLIPVIENVHAYEFVDLKKNSRSVNLKEKIYIYNNKTHNSLSSDEIFDLPVGHSQNNTFLGSRAIWGKVYLKNNSGRDLNFLFEHQGDLKSLDLFIYSKDGKLLFSKVNRSREMGEAPTVEFIHNQNNFTYFDKTEYVLVFKYAAFLFPSYNFSLVDESIYNDARYSTLGAIALFLGIVFSLLLFSVLLYFNSKDRTYLFYCLFVLTFLVALLPFVSPIVYIKNFIYNYALDHILIILLSSGLFLVLFCRSFLKVEKSYKRLDNTLLSMPFLSLALGLVSDFFNSFSYTLVCLAISFNIASLLILIAILCHFYFNLKRVDLKYLLVAWLPPILLFIFVTLDFFVPMDITYREKFLAFLFTSIHFCFFMSTALSHRITILRKKLFHSYAVNGIRLEQMVADKTNEAILVREKIQNDQQAVVLGGVVQGVVNEISEPLQKSKTNLLSIKEDNNRGLFGTESKSKISDSLEKVEASVKRIESLGKSVEILSSQTYRSEPGSLGYEYLNDMIKEVVNINRLDSTIKFIIDDFKGVKAFVVRDEFIKVLKELIQNSVDSLKRTDSNTEKLIFISYSFESDKVAYLKISDNGAGIPEDVGASIFDPFSSIGQVEGRLGLGLYISKRIMEAMDSDIILMPSESSGSYFPALKINT